MTLNENKRLLICTQVVDLDDPILGFFHRLIEEFAKNCSQVHVICLKKGRCTFPPNVHVHSLGKESIKGSHWKRRILFSLRAWWYAWKLRRDYDGVFVHMNEEYVLLLGVLWRFLSKPVGLERNVVAGTWRSRVAYLLANYTFYTSPDAHAARARNACRIPNSIDVDLYTTGTRQNNSSLLFLSRIDPCKRLELVLAAVRRLQKELGEKAPVLHIYGTPTLGSEAYASQVRAEFSDVEASGHAIYYGSVTHDKTPQVYAEHTIFVNVTPLGSFDKTIFEAMAAGCLVVTFNNAVADIVREDLMMKVDTVDDLVRALSAALALTNDDREKETRRMQTYVREHESLDKLIAAILGYIYS